MEALLTYNSHNLVMEEVLHLLHPARMLVPNNKQRDDQPKPTRPQCDEIRRPVAGDAVRARALAAGPHDAVAVEDGAVEEVEDVARYDRRQRHEAPVLAEAVDAEGLGDDGGEHAEEEAVAQAGEPGDEAQEVRVVDAQGADLRGDEDEGGEHEAPDAACAQDLDEEVGADAWGGQLVPAVEKWIPDWRKLQTHHLIVCRRSCRSRGWTRASVGEISGSSR